jgi:large subunit ribosomal protein L35
LEEIRKQREHIEWLKEKVVVGEQEEQKKATLLRDMNQRLEKAKIWADMNDPLVKKKFEDGLGELTSHQDSKKLRTNTMCPSQAT